MFKLSRFARGIDFIGYICLLQSKLKESQYQLMPWRSDTNNANVATQSHSIGAPLTTSVCYFVILPHFFDMLK